MIFSCQKGAWDCQKPMPDFDDRCLGKAIDVLQEILSGTYSFPILLLAKASRYAVVHSQLQFARDFAVCTVEMQHSLAGRRRLTSQLCWSPSSFHLASSRPASAQADVMRCRSVSMRPWFHQYHCVSLSQARP